jgi:preprotein translocase subunit SecF
MTTPPSFIKANPADAPVIFLNLSSATLPLSVVDEYAETMIAQRISTLSGVSQVLVMGQQKFAVRIQANPEALAAKGMTLDDLQNAVAAANSAAPVGTLMGPEQAYTLQANGQLEHADRYQNLIVAYRNGSPVRLKDVATAVDSVENDRLASWYNGQRGILLGVQRQPDANTVQVVDSVKALIPVFEAALPASVKLSVMLDRSVSIRNSVHDVQFTLLLTAGLVVLVIFIFLRNVTATIIPALALPVSVIGTFAGMKLLGYSIDNLSLMALTLSVGFVVDDAIVMLENIVRHVEGGERVMDAAFRGSREIAFTILSITLSLVAVFIPVLFMGGVVGRVFREFAVTISLTILISGFVSLTLTPMLASRLLKASHAGEHHNAFYRWSENGFNALLNGYKRSLAFVLRWRRVTLAAGPGWVPVRDHSQRLFPDRGYRHTSWLHRSRARRLGRQHGGAYARRGQGHSRRPKYQRRDGFQRRQRQQPSTQQRRALHSAEAARRARAVRHRSHPRASPQDCADPRRQRLFPSLAEHQPRRPASQGRLSVYAPGRRYRRALPLWPVDARAPQPASRPPGRQFRPAAAQSPRDRQYRPRQGLAARHHRRSDPQYLL